MKKITNKIVILLSIIMLYTTSASALTTVYTPLGVPTNVNTSFKTYMDWRAITNENGAGVMVKVFSELMVKEILELLMTIT